VRKGGAENAKNFVRTVVAKRKFSGVLQNKILPFEMAYPSMFCQTSGEVTAIDG